MPEFDLTPEQDEVLDTILESRLTVVRAGPGSGKTRVFVEALKRYLDGWGSTRQGIAALSFTNVAHAVITERLGRPPGPPHFVGTIDSFLLRYVVRPFGHLAGISKDGGYLVPAPVADSLSQPQVKYGNGDQDRAPVYRFAFLGGDESAPTMTCPDKFRRTHHVPQGLAGWALSEKRRLWREKGLMTHSDTHYLAAYLLRGPHRDSIVRLVSHRFPVILVDEFQDTGWFLGRAIIELLRYDQIRGAVVGDPDQSIYQFGGANSAVFDEAEKLAGAVAKTMPSSHRCSRAVAKVASALSRTGKPVSPVEHADEGKALLLVHDQSSTELDFGPLLSQCAVAIGSTDCQLGVLSRRRSWTRQLSLGVSANRCPWGSGMVYRLSEAARLLRSGEPTLAARTARNAMTAFVCDNEAMSAADLREFLSTNGLSPTEWRRAVHAVLIEASRQSAVESWNDWVLRMKMVVGEQAAKVGWRRDNRALGSTFKSRPEGDSMILPGPASAPVLWPNAEVLTVHASKGREFHAVLVACPKPHAKEAPCPATAWWSSEPGVEEREVAFVACSRAQQLLALAVHRKTYEALCRSHETFVDLFEVREVRSTKTPKSNSSQRRTAKKHRATSSEGVS